MYQCGNSIPVAFDYTNPTGEIEYLRDTSPKDATWDKQRDFADRMAEAVQSAGYERYAERVRNCALSLYFGMKVDANTGEISLKLTNASFCHWRWCPVCAWRRSLINKAIFMAATKGLEEQYPTARWLMLTLTVRNCEITDLRETIQGMNRAWSRFIKRQEFQVVQGWTRACEITRSEDDKAHPHFHCLLMVPASYFGKSYVKTATWAKIWGECLKVDYTPIVDVRTAKPKLEQDIHTKQLIQSKPPLLAVVAEALKYSTKFTDIIDAPPNWLAEFIKQTSGLKLLTSGGILNGIFKQQKPDEGEGEDLIHTKEDEEPEDGSHDKVKVRFDWYKPKKKYGRKRHS